MKKLNRLSARTVATLTKPGRHADGGNLYLVVDKGGAKRWVFLFHLHNHQHEAGLGSLNSVPLAKAREISADFRGYLAAGLNPIIERRNHRPVRHKTFGQMAQDFLTAHEAGWSNTKHKQQWRTTLETYAAPLWIYRSIRWIPPPSWLSLNRSGAQFRGARSRPRLRRGNGWRRRAHIRRSRRSLGGIWENLCTLRAFLRLTCRA